MIEFSSKWQNRKFAAASLCYLLLLYGTLGVTPRFFKWFRAGSGASAYSWSITIFIICCGIILFYLARKRLLPLTFGPGVILLLVLAGYGLIFHLVKVPAKRLHTIQYGLLSWLVTESRRDGGSAALLHGVSILLVVAAAVGDETIQWLLPNRNGAWGDVLLDLFSAALAQGAIFAVKDWKAGGPHRLQATEPAGPAGGERETRPGKGHS